MKKIVISFVITIYLLSCSTRDSKDILSPIIWKIDPEINNKIKFSTIYKDIVYIPLETDENHLVGMVHRMVVNDGRYYLMNDYAIHAFDRNGSILYSISKTGRGEGEYTSLYWMDIDKLDNNIVVWDLGSRKFIFFDLNSGDFKYEFSCPYPITAFKKISNNLLACLNKTTFKNENNDYLFFINTEGKLISSQIPTPFHLLKIQAIPINTFFLGSDYILFQPDFCDTIYSITPENYKPYYIFDFGIKKIDPKVTKNYQSVRDLERRPYYAKIPIGFLASEEYLFTLINYEKEDIRVFYSAKSKILFYGNEYVNDIDAGLNWTPYAIEGNDLISCIEPSHLIDHYNKIRRNLSEEGWEYFLDKHQEIRELLDKVREMDNPVIMRCRLDF